MIIDKHLSRFILEFIVAERNVVLRKRITSFAKNMVQHES